MIYFFQLHTNFSQKVSESSENACKAMLNDSEIHKKNDEHPIILSNNIMHMNQLVNAMFERIVVLEQHSREQSLEIEKLTTRLNRYMNSGGILVWKITNFTSKVESMRRDASIMYYSPDVFTGPFGYRFCARINVSPKAPHSIGLHLHLMQSDNDYHLDWPFRGCFKIWMINSCDANLTKHDKIMTNDKTLAFARPQIGISPRGFGFLEYAEIEEISNLQYVHNDTLTIKFHISIV